ncbi:DUF3037 domain-containing protein [Pollutibacter soli]|uniref:DUF3037 domain-containing protein n=1 Tax=Pollutibacter soli TaxID=3034157 RepID=UPI0030132B07
MPDLLLFEYAVIRVVPRVEREEFINAGIVVYCKQQQFLEASISLNKAKLYSIYAEADFEKIQEYLCVFLKVCAGTPDSGPIGKLDPGSRFRWLTATRSTIVQSSKVHPGFTSDPKLTLQKLFDQLVV